MSTTLTSRGDVPLSPGSDLWTFGHAARGSSRDQREVKCGGYHWEYFFSTLCFFFPLAAFSFSVSYRFPPLLMQSTCALQVSGAISDMACEYSFGFSSSMIFHCESFMM